MMNPMRIGHRGAAGTAPENTLASMRKALAIGVDAIEFDIHRTVDGVLVVHHDFTLERTTTGTGALSDLTLAQIKQADAGCKFAPEFAGERVPTLLELVETVPAPVVLFLEMKAGSFKYPGIEEELAAFLTQHNLVERTNISSFDHFALKRMKELLPTVEIGMLFSGRPVDPVAMAKACGATALHPNYATFTKEQVREAQAAGLKVNMWTPNTPEAIAYVESLGVDGIITDFPERLASNA